MIGWIFVALIVAALGYIRLAPHDVGRWHVPVTAEADRDFTAGAVRVLPGDAAALGRVDAAARALPRTQVLAGTVDEGRITYVTRSALFGFPDYTTVELADGQLRLIARLRFGRSDLGVNGRRLEGLVAAAKAGG
ncbi:MAG: DUF1499 domain-containing protein [Pseudomonadota bacterium]